MVDSVNSSPAARVRLQSLQTEGTTGGAGAARPGQAATPVSAVDSVVLSDAVSVQLAESLADKGPPFDLERVTRIKQAVAEGRYPVDVDRITESLFQDYAALMN